MMHTNTNTHVCMHAYTQTHTNTLLYASLPDFNRIDVFLKNVSNVLDNKKGRLYL